MTREGVHITKILRVTPGGFHCYCQSDLGIVRKPNNAIPRYLWDIFDGKIPMETPKKMTKESNIKWFIAGLSLGIVLGALVYFI